MGKNLLEQNEIRFDSKQLAGIYFKEILKMVSCLHKFKYITAGSLFKETEMAL